MARTCTGTDRIVSSSAAVPCPSIYSWSIWLINPANFGIQLQHISGSVEQFRFYPSNTAPYTITAERRFANSAGWTFQPGVSMSSWHNIVLTHDATSTSNSPVVYVNGSSVTVSVGTAPSGAVATAQGNFTAGNKSDGTQPGGGSYAYASLHNVILTPAEALEAATYGYALRGRVLEWDLAGSSPEPDSSGNGFDGTVTGTTIVAGPSVSPRPSSAGRLALLGVGS